jgi:hypothetical protein
MDSLFLQHLGILFSSIKNMTQVNRSYYKDQVSCQHENLVFTIIKHQTIRPISFSVIYIPVFPFTTPTVAWYLNSLQLKRVEECF